MAPNRTKRILEYYDKLSSAYSRLYGDEQSAKHKTVTQVLQEEHFGTIVDLGCGDGKLGEALRERSNLIIGLELSNNMLRSAKASNRSLEIVQGDIFHAPFKNGIADCVISLSVVDTGSFLSLIIEAGRIASSDPLMLISILHPYLSPPLIPAILPQVPHTASVPLSARETLYLLSSSPKPVLKNE